MKIKRAKSTANFDSVCLTTPDLICIAGFDGKLKTVNPAWTSILGWTKNELLTMPYMELVHPDDVVRVLTEIKKLKSGKSAIFYSRCRTSKGNFLVFHWSAVTGEKEKTMYVTGRQQQSPEACAGCINHVLTKIFSPSERNERLKKRLDQAKAKAKTDTTAQDPILTQQIAALNVSNIVTITDPSGVIKFVNDYFCQLSGYTKQELIGQTPAIMNSKYHPKSFFADLWRTIKQGNVWQGQIRNRRKDKSFFWVDTVIVPFKDKKGQIAEFVSIHKDITELTILREQAEATTRLKSELLANVSHELRTPMNGILGMANLLSETMISNQQHEYISAIKQSGEALLAIVNNILDMSKIEAGKMALESATFNIGHLCQEVLALLQPSVQQKALSLSYEEEAELPKMWIGDFGRIRQILINILGNSIKFTETGFVKLSTSLWKRKRVLMGVRFIIEDSGIGIDEDFKKRMFQTFEQADISITKKYGGTGLGLSICKKLIEMMEGKIKVESRPGGGSQFVVDIPLLRDRKTAISPEYTSTKKIYQQFKGRVLVAEDNAINQRVAKDMLSKYGLSIDLVGNGLEAVKACSTFVYDMIFMDCIMPEMDGLQATQIIRADAKNRNRQTPIVAMTANAMVGDRANCITAGMNDYLSKPIDTILLEKCLHLWLKKSESHAVIRPRRQSELDQSALDKLKEMEAAGDTNLIKDLVEMFLKTAQLNISKLEKAVQAKDFKEITYTAHSMKSSCATLGLLKLSALLNQIEETARKEEATPLNSLVSQIINAYPSGKAALQELLP
ncbi:MAG: hypothetical protein A2X86_13135 [Bdellovibrionales bacterium GWA2_49_15]|nr:MAG: hypothetical protein A2X86_13135 [Bdellovibrionales bacterium GWA2_49_15]HAZ13467.1 hypothetical protein [Bdellovibrionales bacterium]